MPPNSSDAVTRPWELPPLGDEPVEAPPEPPQPAPPTAEEIEAIQRRAWQEGFEQGLSEGLEAAREQSADQVRALDAILSEMARPLDELDQQVEEELVGLALAVARQLIRREIKTDPGQIVGTIREALALLPVASGSVRIELHPEDARLVRELLNLEDGEARSWQLVEDPTLSRGGCRISNTTSRIDATVENRIHQVIARVLGGERQEDRT